MKHLLDGDAASNTLSWRWVAGMHTNKKPYLASKENINKYTGERKGSTWQTEWNSYVKFHGKPSEPYYNDFCEFAWKSFHMSNRYWNSPGTSFVTRVHETKMNMTQQKIVDNLWNEFLNYGNGWNAWGYMLHNIPARLHADWDRSCLEDPPELSSVAPASAAADSVVPSAESVIMAEPVSVTSNR